MSVNANELTGLIIEAGAGLVHTFPEIRDVAWRHRTGDTLPPITQQERPSP